MYKNLSSPVYTSLEPTFPREISSAELNVVQNLKLRSVNKLYAFRHDFIVVEGAARVKAATFWHVRSGEFFLERFVDQAAVLVVHEALAKDHGRPQDRTVVLAFGSTDDEVSKEHHQDEDGEDQGHYRPEEFSIPSLVG